MYKYEKKQGMQKMILFIVKLFANVKCFGFYIKPSSGHLNMLYCIFWIIFNLILIF